MRCESEPLPSCKHLRNWSYLFFYTRHCFLFHPTFLSAYLGPFYWSHHLRNLLEPSIFSDPVQILYIGLPTIYSVVFYCRLLKYSLIFQIPVTSNATSTEAHSRSLPSPFSISSLQSFWLSCYEIPLSLSSSHPSPPIFLYHKGAPPGLPPYISLLVI